MRNFKRLTFVLLVVALLGLVGCVKKEADLKPIKKIISDIGVVWSLDTEWAENDYLESSVYGNGTIIIVDEEYKSVSVMFAGNNKVAMIEIWYDTKLLTNDIKIDDLTINYADLTAKINIEVNFWEDGNTSTFDSLEQLVNYLNTFNIKDVYNLLYDLDYIRK